MYGALQVIGLEQLDSMVEGYTSGSGTPIVRVVMETGNIVRVSQEHFNQDFSAEEYEVNSSYAHR